MNEIIKKVLTIAGSDSGGGAGIQADIKTFAAFGVYGMSVVTAVTAQNTVGVNGIQEIPADFVGLQFESILSDIGVDGIKTGMLQSTEIVMTVSQKLKHSKVSHIVIDPVMVSTSGHALLEPQAVDVMKQSLVPLADLVTPNIPEAELLSAISIHSMDDMKLVAKEIYQLGCRSVLIKGGHGTGQAIDLLYDGQQFIKYTTERIQTKNTHGTGCTFSAAILANLVKGKNLNDSIAISKKYITAAILGGLPIGKGYGPLNHFAHIDVD